MGYACGFFSADSMLVSRQGPQFLFYVYIFGALLSLALAGLFFLGVHWFEWSKLLSVGLFFLGLSFLGAWWWLRRSEGNREFFILLSSGLEAGYAFSVMAFWSLASRCFEGFEAKRRYPILIAAGIFGEMVGSLGLSRGVYFFGAANFLLVWAVVLILWPAFLHFSLKAFKTSSALPAPNLSRPINPTEPLAEEGLRHSTNRLIFVLFVFWFLFSFFSFSIDYLFSFEVVKNFTSEIHIASYFGQVAFFANLAVLFYQIFLTAPLQMRFGIDRNIFLIPFLTCLGGLILFFSSSLFAYSMVQALVHYLVDYVASGLLHPVLNVLPERRRVISETISEGIGRPAVGILLLLLFSFGVFSGAPQRLRECFIIGSFLFVLFPFLFHRVYLGHLMRCLQSNDLHLVGSAIQALGERDKAPAVPQLLEMLAEAKDIQLKSSIVLTLGQIRSPMAFKQIIALFSLRNERIQLAVVESLARFKSYQSIFALYRLLMSKHNVSFYVRINAMHLLARLVGKGMIPFLLENLEDPDPRVVANAIESIGLLKDQKTIPLLLPFLQHDNHRIRANSVIALFHFRSIRPLAMKALEDLYQSEDSVPRRAALYAIGVLKLEKYKPDLFIHLESEDSAIREFSCAALARMRDPRFVVPYLELLLQEPEKRAVGIARHIGFFPRYSRWVFFEEVSKLPQDQIEFLFGRLEQTPLDFSEEKEILSGRMTIETIPLPVLTFVDINQGDSVMRQPSKDSV
jgi:HEAT repeat protein